MLCASLGGGAVVAAQQPTFREAVDVIEFDVRVVTGSGSPVLGLTANQFEVSINGSNRRVVSADLVEYRRDRSTGSSLGPSTSTAVWPDPRTLRTNSASGRTFVIVLDASSFDVGSAAGVVQAARSFVLQLQPDDNVGLYIFPIGSQINPSTDRGKVMNALQRVSGQPATGPATEFNLRPTELVALSPIVNDRSDRDTNFLVGKLCGTPVDAPCFNRLRAEVQGLVIDHERNATQSLGMLRSLILNLAPVQGRKTLVMISGGIVSSNRPGGRPDIGNLDVLIGQEAIRTNTAIYTLYVDWRAMQSFTAEQRKARNTLTGLAEDSELLARPLDQFTGASGGAMFKALSGSGEVAFKRILDETSAYYVLGVQPAPADRDGKPRQLSVKVKQPGVTVRGSRWVTVPRK